jgi:putrescine transport system substrate-binding protein
MRPLFVAMLFSALPLVAVSAEDKVVHVYNWSDYVAENTLADFTKATGIKVVYDVYDANEVLETKLLAGGSGYDVVFPSARPNGERLVKGKLLKALDKTKLPNFANLDPAILAALIDVDAGNAHLVPYMWGTTGIGYNVDKVKAALGPNAVVDSWRILFDPATSGKLKGCGISVLDDEIEAFAAALMFQGKDLNSAKPADIDGVAKLYAGIRPNIKYFNSSQYINDLANGDLCIAMGYNGDVLQARDRAAEVKRGVKIQYAIPREGAVRWIDTAAIPNDAPHPNNAHTFINYLLDPKVIAAVSNYVSYANANLKSKPLLDPSVRNDPGIYPPPAVEAKLKTTRVHSPAEKRLRVRAWTRIKTGR